MRQAQEAVRNDSAEWGARAAPRHLCRVRVQAWGVEVLGVTLEEEQLGHIRSIVAGVLARGRARTAQDRCRARASAPLPFSDFCWPRCKDGYREAERRCCTCDRGRQRAKAIACSLKFQIKHARKKAEARVEAQGRQVGQREPARLGDLLQGIVSQFRT